jgi:hypothetical protein
LKTAKRVLAIALVAVVVSALMASAVFALGNQTITTSWTTVSNGTGGGGHNRYVAIQVSNLNAGQRNDVRMLGQSGNVVWSEEGAIGNMSERTFWCGLDVYQVQVKVSNGLATANSWWP